MTVSNQTNTTSAVGTNTVGQEVPFVFDITDTSDLSIVSRVTATGVSTDLTETTNYTVVILGNDGGTVTMVTAVATTSEIHVTRNTPMTQNLDLIAGGAFNPNDIEAALDKNTKLIQENGNEITNKAITFPETDSTSLTTEVPTLQDRASKVLSFDANGSVTAITAVPTGSVAFTTFGENMAEAANAAAGLGVLGLDDGSTSLDLAATTVTTLTSTDIVTKGPWLDIRAFGSTDATGAVDSSTAIQAAIDAIPAQGGTVFFPAGIWLIETGLTLTDKFVHFLGVGTGFQQDSLGTVIRKGANIDMLTITDTDDTGFIIEHMKFEGVRTSYTGRGILVTDSKGFRINNIVIRNNEDSNLEVTSSGWHVLKSVYCGQNGGTDHNINYINTGDWTWYDVQAVGVLDSDHDAVHFNNCGGTIYGGHVETSSSGRHGITIASTSIIGVFGAYVFSCGFNGINVTDSPGVRIHGCYFDKCNIGDNATGGNITLGSASDNCNVIGNTMKDQDGNIIYNIRVASDNNMIVANSMQDHVTGAVNVLGDGNKFTYNRGLDIATISGDRNYLVGNDDLHTVTDTGIDNRFSNNLLHLVDNGTVSHENVPLYYENEQVLTF